VPNGNVIGPYVARISAVPAAYIDEAVDIFRRIAERNGGTVMGKYKLTIEERGRRATPEGASVLVYGTPAGFWAWRETGARAHRIAPRNKQAMAGALGHPVGTPVVHPGFAGKRAWTRTIEEADTEILALGVGWASKAAA
jgi:hypothetical protein